MSALQLAVKCIQVVASEAGSVGCAITEAGYTLLGVLCISLPADVLAVSFILTCFAGMWML